MLIALAVLLALGAGGALAVRRGLIEGINIAALLSHRGNVLRQLPAGDDVGLALYRNPKTQDKVVSFYADLAGSPKLATTILQVASKEDVPLSLAFALAWKESNFSPTAVNFNGGSVDRGLFQLNSLSFPNLAPAAFFDPRQNAEKGLSYLSECLKDGGNEIVGLAMYNAGMARVVENGTPRETLDYISTILNYQSAVEAQFETAMLKSGMVPSVLARSAVSGSADF